jgi:hypothetical protein
VSQADTQPELPPQPPGWLLWGMRIGLPALITAIGIVLIIMGHGRYTSVFANRDSLLSAVGVGFIIIALMVALLNWLLRLNMDDAGDRAREEEARQHFRRTGHWPGED